MNEQARATLQEAGFEDVTKEANAQNKASDYAVFADPNGGVHYCFEEEDVIDLAEVATDRMQEQADAQ